MPQNKDKHATFVNPITVVVKTHIYSPQQCKVPGACRLIDIPNDCFVRPVLSPSSRVQPPYREGGNDTVVRYQFLPYLLLIIVIIEILIIRAHGTSRPWVMTPWCQIKLLPHLSVLLDQAKLMVFLERQFCLIKLDQAKLKGIKQN